MNKASRYPKADKYSTIQALFTQNAVDLATAIDRIHGREDGAAPVCAAAGYWD